MSAFLKQLVRDWMAHKIPRLAAAMAYYAFFSLAPLLIVAIGVASYFFEEAAARSEVVAQFQAFLGPGAAEAVSTLLAAPAAADAGGLAALLGLALLGFGASGVFGELQDALNTIWEVAPKPGASWTMFLRRRFLSFTMVLGSGFLLLVSLLLSAALAAGGRYVSQVLPGATALWQGIDLLVASGVPTLLFALIFRYVPDARVAWRDAWLGAIVTAFLIGVGRWAIGYYLGRQALDSTFGPAASLVVFILWVYYSSHILFFGAEVTQVLGDRRLARPVPPRAGAERVPTAKRS